MTTKKAITKDAPKGRAGSSRKSIEERARAIIVATNDDMANLEVAMDARRLNKNVRVLLRLFDQQIAQKIAGALAIDGAFSASALAAPIIAAM